MSSMPSVEPSLTMTHLSGKTVWEITDRIVSPMKRDSFRAGEISTYGIAVDDIGWLLSGLYFCASAGTTLRSGTSQEAVRLHVIVAEFAKTSTDKHTSAIFPFPFGREFRGPSSFAFDPDVDRLARIEQYNNRERLGSRLATDFLPVHCHTCIRHAARGRRRKHIVLRLVTVVSKRETRRIKAHMN